MKRFRLCNFATVIAVKDNEAHMLQTAWYYLLFFSSFFFKKLVTHWRVKVGHRIGLTGTSCLSNS